MRCPGLAALAVAAARAAPSRAQLLYPSGVDLRDDGAAEDDQCVGDQRFEFVLAGVDCDGGDERAEFRNVLHDGFVVGDAARQDDETFALITSLAAQYPGDVGLFSPLLLNVVTLKPGQAMYLDACTPHAYVRGTGLEIMANSDNVLRAGLTPKYIDVAELLDCTRCLAKPDDQILLSPRMEGAVQHYDVPVSDFTFSVYPAGEHALTTASAEILFAIDGTVTLQQGEQSLRLEKGQSAFVPAATGSYRLLAEGRVARAGNRC